MIVNQIAKAADVEPHVVRYYVRIGLLQPRRNPENGYQHFSESDLTRLRCIRELQAIGLTLNDISQLLDDSLCSTRQWDDRLRHTLRRRMEENRKRLHQLSALQARMEHAYRYGMSFSMPNRGSLDEPETHRSRGP